MARPSSLSAALFFAGTSLAALLPLAACSASSSRGSFTEDSTGPTPTSTEDTGPAPTTSGTSSQTGPVIAAPDSGSPDGGGDCVKSAPSNKCGVPTQCGCAAGETCDVVDGAGTAQCITAGTATMGKPCTSTGGCALGLTCFAGTCHSFCTTNGVACTGAGTGKCMQVETTSSTAVPNDLVCLVSCALENPAAACGGTTPAGTATCVVDDSGNTDCETAGTVAANGDCSKADCGPGLVCVTITQGSTTSNVCKKWCRVANGAADCTSGTCGGFGTKEIVGGTEYGACP